VYLDLEIGLAVTVGIALHGHESPVRNEMQLASMAVKVLRTNEVEVLIAVQRSVGINVVDVDVITRS
jgi:hypothetical protein